jgi:signal transduction histidine kinase
MISAPIPSCCSPMTTSGADRRAFAQMLRKLLSNAAKFSPGGTAIEVSIGSLIDGSLQLSVADIGIGMTPEEVALAVQPFGQIAVGLLDPTRGWASARLL